MLKLQITGRVGEREVVYWDGYYYWNPLHDRAHYVSLSAAGAVATGHTIDQYGSLVFEILAPDGKVSAPRARAVPVRIVTAGGRRVGCRADAGVGA